VHGVRAALRRRHPLVPLSRLARGNTRGPWGQGGTQQQRGPSPSPRTAADSAAVASAISGMTTISSTATGRQWRRRWPAG